MEIIDTHSHLYSDKFNDDRSEVVTNAIKSGVSKILLPNISSKYTDSMLDLCSQFPDTCFPMMGIHPCDVKYENFENELNHIEEELNKKKYIAVGEIGLDLYWDKKNIEIQKKAFISQIKLAKKYNLPIVVHVRNAFAEAIEIVESENSKDLQGVFHCFTGSLDDAKRILNLDNFYLGIGGFVTFKKSNLNKVLSCVDIQNILLETDSPYLAPAPFRGKRNESKFIIKVIEKLAEIYSLETNEIARLTTENAKKLFKI